MAFANRAVPVHLRIPRPQRNRVPLFNLRAGDGGDKVNFEWVMENEEGEVFTVYDWKEYRVLDENELIEWHIGGHSSLSTDLAVNEIAGALNELDE